jgi:hypothetical protein
MTGAPRADLSPKLRLQFPEILELCTLKQFCRAPIDFGSKLLLPSA